MNAHYTGSRSNYHGTSLSYYNPDTGEWTIRFGQTDLGVQTWYELVTTREGRIDTQDMFHWYGRIPMAAQLIGTTRPII
jgi:hypothetical protein